MSNRKDRPAINAYHLTQLLKDSPTGVIKRNHLNSHWRDVSRAVRDARKRQDIGTVKNYVYDPERLDEEQAVEIGESNGTNGLPDFAEAIRTILEAADTPALSSKEIERDMGSYFKMKLLSEEHLGSAGVHQLELKLFKPYSDWFYLEATGYDAAYDFALSEAERRHEQAWQEVLNWAGDELRQGAQEGDTTRSMALARLYSRGQTDDLLDMPDRVFRLATKMGHIKRRTCPDGGKRMRAADLHRLRDDHALRQEIEDELDINIWQICQLTDLKVSHLRTMFHNANVQPSSRSKKDSVSNNVWYRWGDARVVLWPENDHPTMSDLEIIEETDGAGRRAWWSDKIIGIHQEIDDQKRKQREAKERRRKERQERRDALRNQMIDNFPSWLREDDTIDQIAYIHVGPTNSGKTHDALIELAQAGSGWYLAPLRLLAREMFERLNRMGALCNLLTGEERIDVPGAEITAATIEMFNPERSGECVIIDEAHMVADLQRGWAWTQALVNAKAPQLRVITAPQGLNLVTRMFESVGVETQVLFHNRLVPLDVADEPWPLDSLPERTILIAFSRRDVLELKHHLQELGRKVSVVYGALPPEVRLKQAQRFESGDSEICVATDAVGMGLNLPADNVVFSTMTKFDGFEQRRLKASELQQIGGRAGRYGLSEKGYVNGIDWNILKDIRRLLPQSVPDVKVARLAPRTDEIELLEGDLAARLTTWQKLNAIPEALRNILTSTELSDRIELAHFLSYNDLTQLGVERALTLVSAPTRKESREYWVDCATAILRDEPLPLPPPPPTVIQEGRSLKQAEMVIACIDVYLWLSYRAPFRHHVEDPRPIIELRQELTQEIDLALMRRFDPNATRRRSRRSTWWYDDV